MAAPQSIELPKEVLNAIQWFVSQAKSATVQLNFKDGRLLNIDMGIHTQVKDGWPQARRG